jgi:glycine betaine/proline transport system ATP-binding protein
MTTRFKVENLDLIYGPRPGDGFKLLDEGQSREAIQKKTGQIVALNQICLDVRCGEILILMGLSGSGKSSLLRCFNGINGRKNGVSRGSVEFSPPGSDEKIIILKCPPEKLRRIRQEHMAMVFQNFALIPWKTVRENIAFPLEIQNLPSSEISGRVQEKMNLVQLANYQDCHPRELSGGMQQRVGLARALVTDAKILLLDEPFSALDPLHRRGLQQELLELQHRLRKTMIFVTHDFDEAIRLGNRIAIIDSGKILQLASPHEIISQPNCEKVQQFTAYCGTASSTSAR